MHPRISPVLNNCALYALTPEIKDEILHLGADPQHHTDFKPGYEQLKTHFAEYYQLDNATLTWKMFADILRSYNAYDIQIILGPVLRLTLKQSMSTASADDYVPDIDQTTEPQANLQGRYSPLAPDILYKYLAQSLGLNIRYIPQNAEPQTFATANVKTTVTLFHHGHDAGEHWERVANVESQCFNYQNDRDTQLLPIVALFEEGIQVGRTGFALLKKHVQFTAKVANEHLNQDAEFLQLTKTAMQIQKYLRDIQQISKNLALRILGKDATEDARKFIQDCHLELAENNRLDLLCTKILAGGKPKIAPNLSAATAALLAPAVLPPIPEKHNENPLDARAYNAKLIAPIRDSAAKPKPNMPIMLNPKRLNSHKTYFYDSLDRLHKQLQILMHKSDKARVLDYDPNYEKVGDAAKKLYNTLVFASAAFYGANLVTQSSFLKFQQECTDAIKKDYRIFAEDRSSWSKLDPILKSLLGFLALVLIIPAAIVNAVSSHGFYATFFESPPTTSSKKLIGFVEEFESMNIRF